VRSKHEGKRLLHCMDAPRHLPTGHHL
jgi:hypothetical protein